jgi:uncharacterized protein
MQSLTTSAFEVRASRIQGRGGFATRDIKRGERIIEYVGDRISHREASERYDDDAMGRHHTFLFAVNSRVCIDGDRADNVARFINHSCEPNCEAIAENSRVFICATRAVSAGNELFYDYAYETDLTAEQARTLYPCKCGSAKCRGTIAALPKARKKVANKTTKPSTRKTSANKAGRTKPRKKTTGAKKTAGVKKPTAKKAEAKKAEAKTLHAKANQHANKKRAR